MDFSKGFPHLKTTDTYYSRSVPRLYWGIATENQQLTSTKTACNSHIEKITLDLLSQEARLARSQSEL